MSGGNSDRVMRAVEYASAIAFASAIGFAVGSFFPLPCAVGGATLAFILSARVLRAVARTPQFILSDFSLPELEEWPDELLLTERHEPPVAEEEPLLLDDVLAEMGPDSRVVRLFDRKAMPTPGQLRSRIDRHLDDHRAPEADAQDASQALLDALAELRQSLR